MAANISRRGMEGCVLAAPHSKGGRGSSLTHGVTRRGVACTPLRRNTSGTDLAVVWTFASKRPGISGGGSRKRRAQRPDAYVVWRGAGFPAPPYAFGPWRARMSMPGIHYCRVRVAAPRLNRATFHTNPARIRKGMAARCVGILGAGMRRRAGGWKRLTITQAYGNGWLPQSTRRW